MDLTVARWRTSKLYYLRSLRGCLQATGSDYLTRKFTRHDSVWPPVDVDRHKHKTLLIEARVLIMFYKEVYKISRRTITVIRSIFLSHSVRFISHSVQLYSTLCHSGKKSWIHQLSVVYTHIWKQSIKYEYTGVTLVCFCFYDTITHVICFLLDHCGLSCTCMSLYFRRVNQV